MHSTQDIEPAKPVHHPPSSDREERLRVAVQYAVLAPSSHNTQPWIFSIYGSLLELIANRSRALPVADPDDRELVISCGAALHHLRTALGAFGDSAHVELLPDQQDPDLLARVELTGRVEPSIRDQHWLAASRRRRTTRFAFEPCAPADASVQALRDVCHAEGAELHVLEDRQRPLLAELIAEADRCQLASPEFRRELAHWLRSNSTRSGDGIPGYAEGMSDPVALLGPFVVRTFDIGKNQAAKDRELLEHSPVLAVLSTKDDRVTSWLRAGAALSAVLLEATSLGLAASFLNQPIEVSSLRPRVAALVEGSTPQLLLRLGRYTGGALRPTPRRGLDDVLA